MLFQVLQLSAFALISIDPPHHPPQAHRIGVLFAVESGVIAHHTCPFASSLPDRYRVLEDILIIPQPFQPYQDEKSSVVILPAQPQDPSLYGFVSEFHQVPPPHQLHLNHHHHHHQCQFVPDQPRAHHQPSHHFVFHRVLFQSAQVQVDQPYHP